MDYFFKSDFLLSLFQVKATHICKFCGKQVKGGHYLKIHERLHTGEKPFSCEICNFECISKFILKKHVEDKHSKNQNEICNVCKKSFLSKSKLALHMKIHSENRMKFITDEFDRLGRKYRLVEA